MAWTAELIEVSKNEAMVIPKVQFTNSDTGETFTQVFNGVDVTAERLAVMVKTRINNLNQRDAAFDTLSIGPITIKPDVVPDADREAFFVLWAKLNIMLIQVQKGIIKSTDQDLLDLQAAVKLAFKPEYESDPRYR